MHRLILSLILLTACNSGEATSTGDVAGLDAVDIADSHRGWDTIFPEISQPEVKPTDTGPPETAGPDTVEPGCEPGEGCFLDPCSENNQCQSGWCVDHLGEGVCTKPCQEDCPSGWTCKPVAGTDPDLVYVCVSDHANLCRPCASGEGCKSVAGAEDVCVDYGDQGSFCGGGCETNEDCPWGFSCLDVQTVDGIETRQCMADAGVCPCTQKSIELGLWTPCEIENEWGACSGKRICTSDGLSECDAGVPATEICNGLDDDCDGDVDDPLLVEGEWIGLCEDGNDCTDDSCQAEAGCVNMPLDEGECTDGNPCTAADHCEGGVCVGDPVPCDDDNPCTDDVCTEIGGCDHVFNTADCDDGDPCTVADECAQGLCQGVAVACDCQTDEDCAALEDGDLCNGTLLCDKSALPYSCAVAPDTIIDCPAPEPGPDAFCLAPACDPDTGACSLDPANEGWPCDDGDACTVNETCSDGACGGGQALPCNDGNPCTDDSCSPATGCVFAINEEPCNDGNPCTTGDTCQAGECLGTDVLACDDGNLCTDDACDPTTGCVFSFNAIGCDDGDACTTEDSCTNGACVGGPALACKDDNPCTDDGCAPATGCVFSVNEKPCDDQDVCTFGDHCHLGDCISSGQLACDDGNPCTDDSCNPATGCQHLPNEAPCDDGNACTHDDACSGGVCVGGQTGICDDGNPCTDDHCTVEGTCVHLPAEGSCPGGICIDGACCVLDTCQSLAVTCGQWSDGCGGMLECGGCGCGETCDAGACVFHGCDGKACGDDGCDGSCGTCGCGETCDAGACVFHGCDGKTCGDDGCDGSCGTCADFDNSYCNNGACDCDEASCGELGHDCGDWDDGCGGTASCGACTAFANSYCNAGTCDCVPDTCQVLGFECDDWDDGCGGSASCGPCQNGQSCQDGVCVSTDGKRVFVTSSTYSAGLGGLSGADAKCQSHAGGAGLGGTWMAWLSIPGGGATTPATRFITKSTGPYRLVNGTKIADNWSDLTDGSLDASIHLDENGVARSGNVWSGTNTSGQLDTGFWGGCGNSMCNGFTAGNTCLPCSNCGGFAGQVGKADSGWTMGTCACCDNKYRIICFEQ